MVRGPGSLTTMQQRARIALLGAGAGIVLLLAVDFATFHVLRVERLDARLFDGFGGLRAHPHVSGVAGLLAGLADPGSYLLLCVVPLAIAVLRRRGDLALLAAVVLLGSGATTHVLKALLDQARSAALVDVRAPLRGAWPSGHATAAMALALCLVLVSAPRWRGRAALGGAAFALGVGYSVLTLGWHYPDDVIGGFLVAFTWMSLGVAAHTRLRREGRPVAGRFRSTAASRDLVPLGAGVLAVLAAVAAATLARPQPIVAFVRAHELLVAGAGGLGTLAVALAAAMVVVLRRA